MALKGGKMRVFESYRSEMPAFKKKKTSFVDKIPSSSNKSSQRDLQESFISKNTNLLTEPSGSKSSDTDGLSTNEEISKLPQPCILNLKADEVNENTTLPTTSQEEKCSNIEEYDCPYLDHLSTIDIETGEPYADRMARKKEIIAELEQAESLADEFPKPTSVKFPVNKLKADCPVCKKFVLAAAFTLHLSKCMGVNSRRSARRSARK